ncbi:AGAP004503-PA [Anopheles gambiae str. PEST]|uniref:TATA box-binding protein-associated factor RNA polymerase I subunit B n=1 Tax=Anopheles gambiae TaxID=7165 RepID=Q7QA01_ANOGA|nr:AGAP004503-PA [Anopheles gambiae str. PEST]
MTEPNDICEVCGLGDFILEDGFYYCTECGTKLLNKREIVDDEVNVGCQTTIRRDTGVENKITSWEQMNYFLHGLTERLIELGAPEELKSTVLQIWCAYLNQAEIAFFHKRQRKRPRLPLNNKKWDLKLLFNRDIPKRAKRKGEKLEGDIAKRVRNLNKDLSKADQDAFTQSQPSDLESTISTLSTSMQSSSNTAHLPLSYKFNSRARKQLVDKFRLPEEHIDWHELEAPTDADCHPFPYSPGKLKNVHDIDNWSYLYRKTVLLAILSIALNQVRSSIQTADLLRWIEEGHLPFHDLRQFLPEGLHAACYSETVAHLTTTFQGFIKCRVISSLIAADLEIVPIEPDLSALCHRFLSELALPLDLAPYITKVIAISPPIKRNNVYNYFPKYEAHAMKYILFVMKLLFGLDGVNETKLDASSNKLNHRIGSFNSLPKLFVWSEWQRYVAMRRIILEQLHYPTNHSRTQSIVNRPIEKDLFLHFFESRIVPDDDNTTGYKAGIDRASHRPIQERLFKNLHSFISSTMDKHSNLNHKRSKKHITFEHSLQPQRAYLAEILEMDEAERHYVHIPEYMRTDHSKRTVVPFINPMPLKMHILTHHRLRLVTKKIKPSMKHIRMAKYNSHTTNVELYLATNKFAHVLCVSDSDSSDSEDSDGPSNILDYINARAQQSQLSPDELFHKTLCENALEEMEADLRAAEFKHGTNWDADLSWMQEITNEINPFENNPPLDEILPDEQCCSETVQIALPNYHYWVNNGNIKDISSEVFEQEYLSLFPASFQFLLREAAYVAHLSPHELYFELNELEKNYFKTYRRIK